MAIDKKTFVGVFDSTNVNKFYNIYTSDATISELNEMAVLPPDAIIISSPIYSNLETKEAYDLGRPAIVMTDSYGTPLALTHSFDPTTFSIDNTTNTVKVKSIAGLDSIVDSVRKELEEIKQSLSQTVEDKFNKLVKSKAVLPNSGGQTSLVSFIDNTTYELKLETWRNQKMYIHHSYNNGQGYTPLTRYTFTIPGPKYRGNADSNIYANYNINSYSSNATSKMEVSVCLSYSIPNAYLSNLLTSSTYAYENNNCFNYINSYFITNYYSKKPFENYTLAQPSSTQPVTTQPSTTQPTTTQPSTTQPSTTQSSTTQSSSTVPTTTSTPTQTTTHTTTQTTHPSPTHPNIVFNQLLERENSYIINNIVGVGVNSSYIITKDITMNGYKIGSYTFLRFPYNFTEGTIYPELQIEEGYSYLASNICKLKVSWTWDYDDLPGNIFT